MDSVPMGPMPVRSYSVGFRGIEGELLESIAAGDILIVHPRLFPIAALFQEKARVLQANEDAVSLAEAQFLHALPGELGYNLLPNCCPLSGKSAGSASERR